MLEAEIVRRQLATLNAIDGVYAIRTHGGSFQQKGTPDVLGCAHGRFFAIESKRDAKEKPTAAQLYNLKQFRRAGGKTFVSHDPKAREVVEWITSL
jgi:Holliday junction resolvase